jgi:hypothetical protein
MKISKNRNSGLIFLFLFLISLHSYAQRNEETIHMSVPKKQNYAEDSFFNKIIVVDNRFDTSAMVHIVQGTGHPVLVKWDKPLKTAIQNYIEQIRAATPSRNETLLIELRQYELNSYGRYFFSANAYYSRGDSDFVKLSSIDTVFSRRGQYYITGEAINLFLQEIVKRRQMEQRYSQASIPLTAIESNTVLNEWGRFPINIAESYPTGVYEFYKTFRKNRPEYFEMNLEKKGDSVYAVTFTDTIPDNKERINNWLAFSGGRGIISYEGKLYYLFDYSICLPMNKKNNTFYFHIPSSLPNMYYINEARDEGMTPISVPGTATNAASGIATAGFFILDYFHRNADVKRLLKEGIKDPGMRDCYIDLETGVVHYQ